MTVFSNIWDCIDQGSFKGFHGSFREVFQVFQECFKVVSRNIEGNFKLDFKGLQGYLKEV